MAGDDEGSEMFRMAGTEVVDGVDDVVVPVLSVGVEDVEEEERKPGVCSARTESRHSPLSTATLRSATSPNSPIFREKEWGRGEETAAERSS